MCICSVTINKSFKDIKARVSYLQTRNLKVLMAFEIRHQYSNNLVVHYLKKDHDF
jgi:hypothetical protein